MSERSGQNPEAAEPTNLTRWEWRGLHMRYNLADGHAHQTPTAAQSEHLKRLAATFLEARQREQRDVQRSFTETFFTAAGQPAALKINNEPLIHYSSSITIDIVAHVLKDRDCPVALLTPTFDNIPAILRRKGVTLLPVAEDIAFSPHRWSQSEAIRRAGAVFLVVPNNPTGRRLRRNEFLDLCQQCSVRGILLILDFSFRFFDAELNAFDQYEVLSSSRASFVTIEDTGKTWPTLDMKVGFTLSSGDVYERLRHVTEDFLLNVSPFVLALLTQFAAEEPPIGAPSVAARTARRNRQTLQQLLGDEPVTIMEPESDISVAWVKLPADWSGRAFVEYAESHGVGLLPGEPFFWDRPANGKNFIRIALLRPTAYFGQAAQHLRETLARFRKLSVDDNMKTEDS